MKINSMLCTDFYKIGHPFQYPKDTRYVYSNLTPRKSRIPGIDEMVYFGGQYLFKEYLIDHFNKNFFSRSEEDVIKEYRQVIRTSLGSDLPTYDHIRALHQLGYLPVRIKTVPEGTRVPMRVPCMTIINTLPQFYWVTNFLETLISATLWQACTSATLAYNFRKQLNAHAEETGMPKEFVQFQGHDFSFRGMSSLESAVLSGMGHLLSFTGTDTIPAIIGLRDYYYGNGDATIGEYEFIGGSVAATEHSVMCSGQKDCEFDTFKRLITEVYPTGILSIVSDTWNLWTVLTELLPKLKDVILQREGKIVIRPDSGDPVDILCGQPGVMGPAQRGVIELLDATFGHTNTKKGYRLLNPKIGAIYGDSINLERERQIAERLKGKGYATQVVLGIGSYTYQYNTRDTFGTAVKATYVDIGGTPLNIWKQPVTDDGTKNSAKGLLCVVKDSGGLKLYDCASPEEEKMGVLRTVFEDGRIIRYENLYGIRERLWNNNKF